MKFNITFKTPNAADHVLDDIYNEEQRAEAEEFLAQWIEYDENVVIEFDTDAETATVQKLS